MRITFICPCDLPLGGSDVIARFAGQLHARDHTVQIVAVPGPRDSMARRVRGLFGRKRTVAAESPQNAFAAASGVPVRWLSRRSAPDDPDLPSADVIVATDTQTAEWLAALSRAKGARVYFVQHDQRTGRADDAPDWANHVLRSWRLDLSRIVTTHRLQELLRTVGGVESIVVPIAVDSAQFRVPPRGRQARPTVGFTFADSPGGGADLLIEAVDRARTQVPDLRCVAITADETAPANLSGGPQIAWHARPEPQQLAAIYSACDVWLFASRYQGAGAEILQAMACRTPVVATATGAAPELVGRGGAGALVRPDDAQDVAKQMVTIFRHPETVWRRLSDAAYATAQGHSWRASTDLLERILSMIYRKGGPVNDLPHSIAAPPAVLAPSRSARPLAP